MYYTDDPVWDADRWDADQQRKLDKLPKCDVCGEPIQDGHYYLINQKNICPECLENEFRREVDDW